MSPKASRGPGPLGKEVVAIIRERMGRLRLSQADLMRMTGFTQSSLSRTLADDREIGVDEIQAIAQALGSNAAALIEEATQRIYGA